MERGLFKFNIESSKYLKVGKTFVSLFGLVYGLRQKSDPFIVVLGVKMVLTKGQRYTIDVLRKGFPPLVYCPVRLINLRGGL